MTIKIGDLFWDKNRDWCDGSESLDACYLVLSGDREFWEGKDHFVFKCAFFVWAGGGYMGAPIRPFEEYELMKMTKIGNISSIKSFEGR